jgi:hypothetical protein
MNRFRKLPPESNLDHTSPDANVWDWYGSILPAFKSPQRVVDWGAGLGRFVPLYEALNPKEILLIEPNEKAAEELTLRFQKSPCVRVLKNTIEETDLLELQEPERSPNLHFCNFVLNCIESLDSAFDTFEKNSRPGDRMLIFTSVFVPATLATKLGPSLRTSHIALRADELAAGIHSQSRPSKKFQVALLGSTVTFEDYYRELRDFGCIFKRPGNPFTLVEARLFHPCGFEAIPSA